MGALGPPASRKRRGGAHYRIIPEKGAGQSKDLRVVEKTSGDSVELSSRRVLGQPNCLKDAVEKTSGNIRISADANSVASTSSRLLGLNIQFSLRNCSTWECKCFCWRLIQHDRYDAHCGDPPSRDLGFINRWMVL
ncbi:unnamed protein product [Cylicocyclus nassatus]|uniref:Uncharacterized protein n=1 Tax=Cylicocyclus nassatus TaxID=53992 RepID=A0AA36MCE7_CYLNA|nr:unnamed protein product [Cylicocyclus nassatus]